MGQDAAATRKYWTYFIVTTIITLVLLVVIPEWFWVTLPFPLTYLVMALDKM